MMPTIRELIQLASPRLTPEQDRLLAAAMEYVIHGWGVIPGSACDGQIYTKGHTQDKVGDLGPALPSSRILRDARVVWSRWALAPYGILARAGESFDVLEVPTWLVTLVAGRAVSRRQLGPVSITPSGVRMHVAPGSSLRPGLSAVRGVQIVEAGGLVPLPPTRTVAGLVTWWITPEQVDWQLGDGDDVQDVLGVALDESRARGIDGAGGEARA